jgi:hypothetical protein
MSNLLAGDREPWLNPLRAHPRFVSASARARHRHAEAEQKFREAGGTRLLGLA